MKSKLKKLLGYVLGLFPTAIPTGMAEYDKWARSFLEIYDLPTQNEDSVKFVLASIIMHLGPQVAYKPKHFFYLTIRGGAAKQVAGAVFSDIKRKQQDAEKAAQEAAKKAADEEATILRTN